jgi:photosystem II stability/assembly factor-like uncharacterized protein
MMAERNDSTPQRELDEEIVGRLQSELGFSTESIQQMSEERLAWVLNKMEIPDRPRARLEHERGALIGDDGTIRTEGQAQALAQLTQLRAATRSLSREVAGMPVGSATFGVDAREEGPTAGLNANNTGWIALGPGNIGGRTRALVIDPTDTTRIFAAGVGGGVWRSTDSGGSWFPTDDLMANLAVCSLVMDPTDPNTLYAGTGEGFSNVDAVRGEGIFKTTDGGFTWNQITPSADSNYFYVNSLAISNDGQTLLAGTTTGIFRSTDRGQTWNQVFNVGVSNLVFDPNDSNKAVAGGLRNGRAYFSTDGGDSWQEATRPVSGGGRVQVCYAAANTSTVYASVDASSSQIWRSMDGGQTYASRNATSGGSAANFLGGQGWYDNVIWAGDPTNVNLVIVGGIDLWRSTDGGNTLTPISTWWSDQSAHADHHAIVADPGYNGVNNRRVYFGNDGGISRTEDVTTVGNNGSEPYTNGWSKLNNGYGVTQFYYGGGHIGSNTIMGGTQDNGTLRHTPAQGPNAWNKVWGGDGGDIASDPSDPQVWYGEYVYLQIFRDTTGGSGVSLLSDYICGRRWNGFQWVWKPVPFSIPDAQNRRAQFIAPFELDPNDPNRLLGGGIQLWRTNDAKTPNTAAAGPSWASIKAPIGNSTHMHSITAIAIADGDSDVVVVGHANGDIYRSTDGTAASPNWQRIDTNGINANRQCLALTIDPDDHGVIYAAFGGYQSGNLWWTDDGGQSWTDISAGLPEAPIRDVTLHPQRSSWVYLATEVGVFASEDGGATWSPTNEGPANVACRDFFWMGCRLVCVTHGRGMFEIDIPIANAFPAPVLAFTGTENYTVQGNLFTRYKLSITNRAVYPDSLFRPSPDLPPCGNNPNASRTWVDIYNGDTNQRIYGFCALDSADDLDRLWFALPQGDTPPSSVYMVLRDRRCAALYTSNEAPLALGEPRLKLWSHRWLWRYTIIRAQLYNPAGTPMTPDDGAAVRLVLQAPGASPESLGEMRWHRAWRSFYYFLRDKPPGARITATGLVNGVKVAEERLDS